MFFSSLANVNQLRQFPLSINSNVSLEGAGFTKGFFTSPCHLDITLSCLMFLFPWILSFPVQP